MISSRGLLIMLSLLHFLLPLTSWARTPHSCYWGANKLAPDDFLPCYGSTTTAQYSCCQAGDKCLEGNACYDSDTGVTYQYGCTDSTFKDPHCPQKCNLDLAKSHWVGLIFCNGSNGLPNDTWVCHHPDNCGQRGSCASQVWGDTLKRQPPTGCEDVKHGHEYVALETIGIIKDLVPLPAPSQTASWWSANSDRYKSIIVSTPTTNSIAAYTTLTTMPSAGATTSGTSTAPASTSPPTETPSAGPADPKASLRPGLGIGIPATTLLFLVVFLILYIKRDARTKRRAKNASQATNAPNVKNTIYEREFKELWKWCMRKVRLASGAPFKKLWKRCMKKTRNVQDSLYRMVRHVKDTLCKPNHEKEHNHAPQEYEPKLELDSSPVMECPRSPVASELSGLPVPVPVQWRVTNGSCASPASTVRSQTVGEVGRLRVHDAGVAA